MSIATRVREEDDIVMFPFMAQGHIIPFLALATQIQQTTPSCRITIVNTPININKLRSSLPSDTSLRLIELPFCSSDHGLPPDSESTDVLPHQLIGKLVEAAHSLKPSFDQLIFDITQQQQQGHPPLCIIADMFFGWTVDVANKLNIFHSIFITSGAYSMAIYYSLWVHLPHSKTDLDEFFLPDFPQVSTIHRSQLPGVLKIADGSDIWSKLNQGMLTLWWKSDGILISTIEELDKKGLEYFRRNLGGGKPVWPILPTLTLLHDSNKSRPQIYMDECINWLNTKPPASVLFVSFGSQNTVSCSELMELAIGLKESGKNFIWVVRPPLGFDINGEFRSEWLPEGFEEDCIKQGNRGLVVRKWAPQLEILSHKSTCAFLSHCGWNSVLESLSYGVPIIGWPLEAEQFYNSKFLEEEVGVCIEVARRNDLSSEVKHHDIKRVIELVMDGTQKGEDMKKKAGLVKLMINNAIRKDDGFKGPSVKAIVEFISTARSVRKTAKGN